MTEQLVQYGHCFFGIILIHNLDREPGVKQYIVPRFCFRDKLDTNFPFYPAKLGDPGEEGEWQK